MKYPNRFRWTPAALKLLGTANDTEIGKQLGLPSYIVANKRRLLGIRSPNSWTPWKAEHVAMLGTMTDVEVARRTGRTNGTVCIKRKRLGIPAYKKPPTDMLQKANLPKAAIKLLGKQPDSAIARQFKLRTLDVSSARNALGIHPVTATEADRKEWSAAELKLFELFTDCEVAEKTGRHLRAVKAKRFDVELAKVKRNGRAK